MFVVFILYFDVIVFAYCPVETDMLQLYCVFVCTVLESSGHPETRWSTVIIIIIIIIILQQWKLSVCYLYVIIIIIIIIITIIIITINLSILADHILSRKLY